MMAVLDNIRNAVGGASRVGGGAGRVSTSGASGRTDRWRLFAAASIGDFVLTLIVSVGLVSTVSFGFESAPMLRANTFVVTLAVVPLLAILFAGSWSKRAVAWSAAGAVAYSAVILGVCVAAQPYQVELFTDGVINDDPQSYVIFGIVLVVVPVLVYLLSRRRVGAVVLFVSAAAASGLVYFLYPEWGAVNSGSLVGFVTVVACGALLLFRVYRQSVYSVDRLGATSFGSAFVQSGAISLLCAGAGWLVFVAVISPLGLQSIPVKPFEYYYIRPVVEYTGVYDTSLVEDPDTETSTTNDQVSYTNQEAEGGSEGDAPDSNSAVGSNPVSSTLEQMASFDMTSWLEEFMVVSYERLRTASVFVVVAVILFLVVAAFSQRFVRARRLARFERKPLEQRICALYDYLCRSFAKIGFGKPDSMTPLEYAFSSVTSLAQFSQGTDGVDFVDVTLAYQRACLDVGRATEQDWQAMKRYYASFYRNARLQLGTLRWMKYYWRV